MPKYVQCICNHIYYPVSRENAEDYVKKFNQFYEGLSDKSCYNGPSSITKYEHCIYVYCNAHYSQMKIVNQIPESAKHGTINPIIEPE